MSKKEQKEKRDSATEQFKAYVPPGSTVWAVLQHVSASRTTREITFLVPGVCESVHFTDGISERPTIIDVSYHVAVILGYKRGKKGGVRVYAHGMDAAFHAIEQVARIVYPDYVPGSLRGGHIALNSQWI